MDHGKIVTRGWELGWNNKWMYVLGAVAALTGGVQIGGSQGAFDFSSFDTTSSEIPPFLENNPIFQELLRLEPNADPMTVLNAILPLFGVLAALIAVALILAFIFFIIGLGGRAGLILAVNRAEEGEKSTLGQNLRDGFGYIVPLFLMKLVLLFGTLLAIGIIPLGAFLVIIGAASGNDSIGGLIFGLVCLLFCLIFPLMLILGFVDAYAFRGIVLRGEGVFASLGNGFRIFRANLSDSFVLALIFWVISLVVGVVIGLVVSPVSLLFANPFLEYFMEGTVSPGATASIIIGSLVLTTLYAVLTGILVTWQSTTFTIAYRQFTGMESAEMTFPPIQKDPNPDFIDKSGDFV